MAAAALALALSVILGVNIADNFRDAGAPSEQRWACVAGTWRAVGGKLITRKSDREAWLVWRGLAPPREITAEVKITPREGRVPGQWCAAGLALYLDQADYWRLALVEAADDKSHRYFELVERFRGLWQAQNAGETALKVIEEKSAGSWEYGHTYLFRLTLKPGRLTGEIYEGQRLIWMKAYRLPDQIPAVKAGWPALTTTAMAAEFADFRADFKPPTRRSGGGPATAAVLHNTLPGAEREAQTWIAQALRDAGFRVVQLDAREVYDKRGKIEVSAQLLVVPSAQVAPVGIGWLIERHLSSGGRLMVQAAGQPFKRQLVFVGGKWVAPDEAQAQAQPVGTLLEVNAQTPQRLQYSTDEPKFSHSLTVEAAPDKIGGQVLHARIEQVRSWANWRGEVTGKMTHQNGAISFWAKGSPNTHHLVIELVEDDASRWMAVVDLTPQWKRYVLAPHRFKFWRDCPARGKRGFATDMLRPEHVVAIAIGLARSHAPISSGAKEFWISAVRFCPILTAATPAEQYVPEIDAVAPWYKTFDHPGVRQLRTAPGTPWPEVRIRYNGTLRSAYARPWGRVMTGARSRRWIPIIEARDSDGFRSYPAALMVRAAGRFAGASWSYWGLPARVLRAGGQPLRQLFIQVARAQVRGVWMVEAGPDQVAYMHSQPRKWGAAIVNASGQPRRLELVLRARREGRPAGHTRLTIDAPADQLAQALQPWNATEPGIYEVTAELRENGKVIDRITTPVRILSGQADPEDQYVRVERGRFWVGGRTWFPHGVNFWPRYVCGLSARDYGLAWQLRQHYDPVLVEEDLAIAESVGITAVSIQAPRTPEDLPCLWDFLERCRAHNIRVNLFVHVDPRGFDPDYVRSIINGGQLWKFSTIYAYDITWEPRWGNYPQRRRFDEFWRRWIADQYGAIEAAEKVWGFKAPRDQDGKVTGPSDDQLANDGPWRVFVAAYRRFVDDFLSAGYGRSCRFIRSMDGRHLISNRAGWGGTGNPHTVRNYQFDPLSGGAHLDFISPEGYGMRPDEGDYKRWGFIDAYCRWAGGGRPVFWSEFGNSIYPGYAPSDYERQRRIWANCLELVLFAGADGDAGWWWPGGYRVNERSDFGCTEPWGKPRPSGLELKRYAPRICRRGVENRPERFIIIDRDSQVSGLAGLWQQHLAEYLRLADGKHVVRVRTAGDGVKSTELKLVGVGNVPYRGVGPVKFLRAEFTAVAAAVGEKEYRPDDDFIWGDVRLRVPARRGTLRLTLLNIGEATWVAPGDPARPQRGAVRLIDCSTGRPLAAIPHDVARYQSVAVEVPLSAQRPQTLALQLEAAGRCRFGQKLTVRIVGE